MRKIPPSVKNIREGSVVIVRPSFGNEPPIKVTVTEGLSEHKYAYAFGYTHTDGSSKWAYDHQIDRVVSL